MSVASAQPLVRGRSVRADVLVVGVATTYVTVSTADVKLAGVPLKLFAVLAALLTWLLCARPWDRMRSFRFGVPVLITGVAVPVVWFAIAAILAHTHDPAQRDGLSSAVQEGSRFVYLLLYFPLADRKWLGDGSERLWVWPALLLCAITIGLFGGYLTGARYGTTGTVGPFQGSIGVSTNGTFRDFLVNDIMFLPLFALLIARLGGRARSRVPLAGIAVVLGCAYLAHARGLWLAMCVTVVLAGLAAMPAGWPVRVRRAAWSLAGLGCVAAVIVLADPDLARRLVRALTTRGELSTALRLDQAPQLLHGFRRNVIFGSGLGAVLPSGFVRDPGTPWTFELTYLQLLFEVGVVGLALVLAPATACLWKLGRSLRGCVLCERPLGFALLGGLAGFLLAAAGNPYLLTSVGMYALAVFLATAERELAEPVTGHRPGRPALAAFAGVALAALGLTAVEFRASRATSSGAGVVASATRIEVPSSARRLLHQPLASEFTRQRLWSFQARGGRLEATPLTVFSGKLAVGVARELGKAVAGAQYEVADWNGDPAAFELSPRRAALTVRSISLTGPPRLLSDTRGALPALTHGWVRYVGIATSLNGMAVAVAVDRSPVRGKMRVSWFALGPGGEPRTFERTAALGPFTPGRWVVRLGAVLRSGPDIGLIGTPPGGELQIRVLSASSGYAASGQHGVIALPLMPRRPLEFLISQRDGTPLVYTVDPSAGVVEELGL